MSLINKPMLAATLNPEDIDKLTYPVLVSYKLDGIRCEFLDKEPKSRNLKKIPNTYIHNELTRVLSSCSKNSEIFSGEFDGEILSSTTSNFQESTHNIMSFEGEPDFVYYIFDVITDNLKTSYEERMELLLQLEFNDPRIVKLTPTLINNKQELEAFEEQALAAGYEGIIIRSLTSPYKCGRSTLKEGYLLKLKRFSDSEAEILGFEEKETNNNIAKTNALGRTERSTHKANMIGAGTLGTLLVRNIYTKVEFRVGSGLDDKLRKEIWNNQANYLGKVIKYKYFSIGMKEDTGKPRFPIFLGFRNEADM